MDSAGAFVEKLRRAEMVERTTLCLPDFETGIAMHGGDRKFRDETGRCFDAAENDAAERTMKLKARLRDASTTDFWRWLMEGMTDVMDAQYGFVSKRMLLDDQSSAVEMPPIGEPGSCICLEAFYWNDGRGATDFVRDLVIQAYGAPCGHMKHDKVFVIPERMGDFITRNPNEMPFPADAYMAVPLFADGKCFAHVGVMWTRDALERRRLSWGFLEMFMHTLEDLVLDRLLTGRGFTAAGATGPDADAGSDAPARRYIPHDAVLASQSLKPYARSLSHELRTPMQGVVGMLDVMHVTIQEAADGQPTSELRKMFDTLRENIEVLQDSSRRAVEAADNVVHAYDFDLGVPDTPEPGSDEAESNRGGHRQGVDQPSDDPGASREPTRKRRREADAADERPDQRVKHRSRESAAGGPSSIDRVDPESARRDACAAAAAAAAADFTTAASSHADWPVTTPRASRLATPERGSRLAVECPVTPGQRLTRPRALLPSVVQECLQHGGRPDSVVTTETELGEDVVVHSRDAQGKLKGKLIRWTVDPSVPAVLSVDERDMSKLISCLVLNAIKFTEEGLITVAVTWGPNARHVVVSVEDTGSGIPRGFQPSLFKAFSREDDSLTRRQDGLGLGLLVAKGIARNIRGDVLCVRSETDGPLKGSLFEIRIPTSSRDVFSAPGSPLSTPTAFEQRRGDEEEEEDEDDDNDDDDDDDDDAPASKRAAAAAMEISIGDGPSPDRPGSRLSVSSSRVPAAPNGQYSNGYERPPVSVPDGGAGTRLQRSAPARVDPWKSLNFDRGLAKRYPLTFLVVEDNHINRKLLVNMLSKLGYTDVYEAFDGLEAIRQMNEPRDPAVDVVLMDLWMPRMDGFDATRHILGMAENRGALPPRPSSPSSVPVPSAQPSSSLPRPSPETSSHVPAAICPMLQRLYQLETGARASGDTGKACQACDGGTEMTSTTTTTTTTTMTTAGQKHHLTVLAVTADVTAEASARAEEVGMKGLMTKPFKLVDLERSILRYCVGHLKPPGEQGNDKIP